MEAEKGNKGEILGGPAEGGPAEGSEEWGPKGGAPKGGGPKISRFFFFPLLGVVSWNFGGVFEGRDPQMCTFGVLEEKKKTKFGRSGVGWSG